MVFIYLFIFPPLCGPAIFRSDQTSQHLAGWLTYAKFTRSPTDKQKDSAPSWLEYLGSFIVRPHSQLEWYVHYVPFSTVVAVTVTMTQKDRGPYN